MVRKSPAPNWSARNCLMAGLQSSTDECMIWPGAVDRNGYGQIKWNGKTVGVHRLVLELALGRPLLPGMDASHTCPSGHNSLCFNRRHLVEETRGENLRRSPTESWQRFGAQNGSHTSNRAKHAPRQVRTRDTGHHATKLTTTQVEALCGEYQRGELNTYQLATKYGLTQPSISRLLRISGVTRSARTLTISA